MSDIINVDQTYTIANPKTVQWAPLPDITTFELAQAIPSLLALATGGVMYGLAEHVATLPDGVRRHFKIGQ